MTERVLLGPFLTRAQAARRANIFSNELRQRPDLLRIGGFRLEEAYFAFQFDRAGVRPDVGRVVQSMKTQFDDLTIADWLVRPNQALSATSPLNWLSGGGSCERVLHAAVTAGPLLGDGQVPIAPTAIPPPEPLMETAHHVVAPHHRTTSDTTFTPARSH